MVPVKLYPKVGAEALVTEQLDMRGLVLSTDRDQDGRYYIVVDFEALNKSIKQEGDYLSDSQ